MNSSQHSTMICEDDCALSVPPDVGRSVLKQTQDWLSKRQQGWLTCQLGAQPCGQVKSQRKVVKKLKHGTSAHIMSPKLHMNCLHVRHSCLAKAATVKCCNRTRKLNPCTIWCCLGFVLRIAERAYLAHAVLCHRNALPKLIALNEQGQCSYMQRFQLLQVWHTWWQKVNFVIGIFWQDSVLMRVWLHCKPESCGKGGQCAFISIHHCCNSRVMTAIQQETPWPGMHIWNLHWLSISATRRKRNSICNTSNHCALVSGNCFFEDQILAPSWCILCWFVHFLCIFLASDGLHQQCIFSLVASCCEPKKHVGKKVVVSALPAAKERVKTNHENCYQTDADAFGCQRWCRECWKWFHSQADCTKDVAIGASWHELISLHFDAISHLIGQFWKLFDWRCFWG